MHQSGLCLVAIRAAEQRHHLAPGALGAISRVETGRPMPVTGEIQPWPWTLNVAGTGYWFDTRAQAATATAIFLARADHPDVDVGCMQVSMRYHRDLFANLTEALDPQQNVEAGAGLLSRLAGGRTLAVASGLYHSATPSIGAPYRDGVAAMRRTQRDTLANAAASGPDATPPDR